LLKEYEAEEVIPSSRVFPELDDPKRRPGALLESARIRAGLSQDELAEKTGIPQSNISAMEHGTRPIGPKVAKRSRSDPQDRLPGAAVKKLVMVVASSIATGRPRTASRATFSWKRLLACPSSTESPTCTSIGPSK
jgi:DNA-binding XRE family transcriptional regulator